MTTRPQPDALLDLDGVLWLADEPIAGAARAVTRLREAGWRVAFFTNNSYPPLAAHVDKLRRFGVPVGAEDVLTAAQAAAVCCHAGERALVLGGAGILEALADAGVAARAITDEDAPSGPHAPDADVVVVGIDPHLSYRRLAVAAGAIRRGARFVATNTDATFPAPDGLVPGSGALVAAVRVASGVEPEVAGKPEAPAVALARQRLGTVSLVIGDRPVTDGLLARRLGTRFGLVLSGVTPPGHGELEIAADLEADDLAGLVDVLLDGTGACAATPAR